jgi:hypothetical protein
VSRRGVFRERPPEARLISAMYWLRSKCRSWIGHGLPSKRPVPDAVGPAKTPTT